MHVPDPDVKGRPPVTSQGGGPDARCATITAASIARQIRLPFAINVGDLPEAGLEPRDRRPGHRVLAVLAEP